MDSLSQFVLGAACGEATLGKKIGNKAILWGGIAGTLPDLDVIFMPFLNNPAYELGFHRGYSHSFFFLCLLAPLLAFLLTKWYNSNPKSKQLNTSFRDWFLLFFLALNTHTILDSFTTWGTQLFLPFSDMRVAINNIFVADPLYTLPFCLFVFACLFFRKDSKIRRLSNYTGIAISCLYLAFTFYNKSSVNLAFENALKKQNIQYNKYMTAPTPLNNLLWYGVIETDEAIYQGLYSIFDEDKDIQFEKFEHQKHLIKDIKDEYAVDRVTWFANDYYIVRNTAKGLTIYDAKFGKKDFENLNGKIGNRFIFPFIFHKDNNGEWTFEQDETPPDWEELEPMLPTFKKRMFGDKSL